MKTLIKTIILLLSVNNLLAQEWATKVHELKFSIEIESEFEAEKLNKWSAAYYYTYIGEYEKALEKYEMELEFGLDTLSDQDKKQFHLYNVIPAQQYLKEKTKEAEILIISEAHQKPEHRMFTTAMLEMLYENGYRYLGIEALNPNFVDRTKLLLDTMLNDRGYPLNNILTGTYTREPQMGNMIREAIKIGFKVFPYERMKGNGSPDREIQQAENIKKFREQNPNGKMVIHCGWHHAMESELEGKKKWMAFHLKQKTGIDPMTIYLDGLTSKKNRKESPYYKEIKSTAFSVLVDQEGNTFNGADSVSHFDVMVYNPRPEYKYNRPNWLYDQDGTIMLEVDKDKLKRLTYPIIVKAILKGESRSATPVDVIELDDVNDETRLVLKEGETYILELVDIERKKGEYEVSLKLKK